MSEISILVVDDEPNIVNLVASYLQKEGFQVHTAADGQTALRAARAYRPEIIIKEVMQASQRIAEGHYQERVKIQGSVSKGEVDELGALAISFNRMAASLDATEQMRRQLIADVTHELRTPLTTIQGYMEGLVDGVLPAEDETYMAVYREADRLKRLVNDLQELSRVEAGAFKLELETVAPGR